MYVFGNLSQVTEISLARQTFAEGTSPWKTFVNHLLKLKSFSEFPI